MADKDIDIRIKATGAAETAAEFRKAEKAIADLTTEMEEGQVAAREFAESLDAEKAAQEQEKQAQAANRRTKEIAGAVGAITAAAALAGKAIAQVKAGFASLDVEELRKIDSAMADQVETAGRWAMALEDPLGSLIALANGGTTIAEAFADANEALTLNAEARDANIDRMIDRGIIQVEAIKKLTDEIERANVILDARDKADSVERDNADAAAIRAGAAPEDVRAKRAQDEAAKELARIDRQVQAAKAGLQELFDNSRTARGNADEVRRNPDATREKIAEADEKARLAEDAFQKRADAVKQVEALASEERRAVRAGAAGTVVESAAAKDARLAREKEKAQQAEERRLQQEAAQQQRQRDREANEQRRREAETRREGKEGLGLADQARAAGAPSRGVQELVRRSQAAINQPTQQNDAKLEEALDSLLNWAERKTKTDASNTSMMMDRIKVLQSQIKLGRRGDWH